MTKKPRISETEWEVMKVIWTQAPCGAEQIIAELTRADATWHPKTVKAFLNRLVKKGVLGFQKEGRAYMYRPLMGESECIAAASESFLDRVFGGSLKPMLAHFVERKKLSAAEVRELRELLEKREPARREPSKQE
jgi:BlaI family transcriptional regulator, penicillinase repressor